VSAAGSVDVVVADTGSADADHVTHVHVATNDGGHPNGNEAYRG
jgi:hypothetical protein